MFQRFASALFGDDVEELSRCSRPGDGKEEEEEDEDWILVNYLAEACSSQCGDSLPGATARHEQEEEEEEDLVMIPSPVASPPVRYASCTSLNSMADTDPDGCVEEEDDADDEDEESGFLRLDACSLEESWFVTPPPCFTGRGSQPILLETSPLENLLIEHPSMSVYAHHSPLRLTLDPLQRTLDRDFLSGNMSATPTASGGKEKARRTLDGPCHSLLQQWSGNTAQRTQPLSRNALRRLNLLRPPKAGTVHLQQPSQRHLNF
uniref:Tumor protein p53 inducible nuclear protein 1 n=1 Tax=Echeneis naucrates TaxID=173247 RepID=A0A665U196_ECHNA